jgi:hypothetical protein
MKLSRLAVAAILAVGGISTVAWAAGTWSTLPIVGGSSFCAGNVGASSAVGGITGQGAGSTVCDGPTVPAGPTTSTGLELIPADTQIANGGQPQTVVLPSSIFALGARSDVTSPATATIPANTPYYFLDGAQAGAFTITMPPTSSVVDGYIQRIFCTSATVGVLTVAANTSQTLKNNPNAACTAGVGYAWIFNAANATWFRYQ